MVGPHRCKGPQGGAAFAATLSPVRPPELPMLLTIAIVLFVLWALGFLAFNIASGIIHLALFLAVIAVIAHFVRRRAPRAV